MRSEKPGQTVRPVGQPLQNAIHRGPLPHSVGVVKSCSQGSINSPALPFRAEKSQIFFG
jgi:hypothetical protein